MHIHVSKMGAVYSRLQSHRGLTFERHGCPLRCWGATQSQRRNHTVPVEDRIPHSNIRYHICRYIAAPPPHARRLPPTSTCCPKSKDKGYPIKGMPQTEIQTQPPPRSRSGVTRARARARPNTASPESLKSFDRQKADPTGIYAENKSLTIAATCAENIKIECSNDAERSRKKTVMARTA